MESRVTLRTKLGVNVGHNKGIIDVCFGIILCLF